MPSRHALVLFFSAALAVGIAGCDARTTSDTPPDPEQVEHLREDFTKLAEEG